MAKIVGKPNAEDVKRVAVAALVAALDDGKEKARKNPRLTGMRAVATGAVLYTAGKAAFSGRRFVRDHLLNQDEEEGPEAYEDEDEAYEDDEEPVAEEDEEGEPVAEEDEDFEDEEDEEPSAEEDEDFEDEDFEDEEDVDEERSAASEPPVHPDDEDIDEDDLPARPSKKRKPVGRF